MSATQSAKSVVIVGGTGFVGRCLTRTLMSQGHHVRVVTRKKTTGAMPGFQPTELAEVAYESADAREAALAGSDALINLCGILHQSARKRFEDVHERLPAAWTQSAVRVGVQQVLHMSALRADMTEPPSAYLRSKAAGERAVCAHADAIAISVFRPSIIFGDGDNFFGQFAGMLKWVPVFPLVCPDARFAPVWVEDVARAFAQALRTNTAIGKPKTYDLCGPAIYRFRELIAFTAQAMGARRLVFGVPDWAARLQGRIMQVLPNPVFTLDNYHSLQADSVCSCNGFDALDLSPARLEDVMAPLLAR